MLRTIALVLLAFAFATCWHIGGTLNYFLIANVALATLCATILASTQPVQGPARPHWTVTAVLDRPRLGVPAERTPIPAATAVGRRK